MSLSWHGVVVKRGLVNTGTIPRENIFTEEWGWHCRVPTGRGGPWRLGTADDASDPGPQWVGPWFSSHKQGQIPQ